MAYSLELQRYYPGEIEITSKDETPEKIVIINNVKVKNLKPDNISFKAEASKITFLAGQNGAGKTTWIRIASGLLGATSGMLALKKKMYLILEKN
ncbi:MAG TPA: ATP-binding cassette domain-containing protein [Pseudobacteroides sp.]|uniref:ATP-binding cassette domain-containing protein n=1 Tax=Pseudobacteroides sp. TaxID=1968840 RepID=UPI002F923AA3